MRATVERYNPTGCAMRMSVRRCRRKASTASSSYRVVAAGLHRGRPTDNAVIESFNGRFREECLNAHWFLSQEDAKEKIDAWRWKYTENRPHRFFKGLTPKEFARLSSCNPVADSQS